MSRRALDANILLRYVTGDHPEMSPRCRRLLERIEAGEELVFLPEAALADVAWTLRSHYQWPAERISEFLGEVLALDGIEMERKPIAWGALAHLQRGTLDFSDAMIAAEMESQGLMEVYSYDRDFDRLTEIRRVEP